MNMKTIETSNQNLKSIHDCIRAYTDLRRRQLEYAMQGNVRESAKFAQRIKDLECDKEENAHCAGSAA